MNADTDRYPAYVEITVRMNVESDDEFESVRYDIRHAAQRWSPARLADGETDVRVEWYRSTGARPVAPENGGTDLHPRVAPPGSLVVPLTTEQFADLKAGVLGPHPDTMSHGHGPEFAQGWEAARKVLCQWLCDNDRAETGLPSGRRDRLS